MALHRLTQITLAVPDVAASSGFFAEAGLEDHGSGALSTRDAGHQIQLTQAPRRQLLRFGIGADDGDDLARIARQVRDADLGEVLEESEELVVLGEPATGLKVEVTVAPRLNPTPAPTNAANRPGKIERTNIPEQSVLTDQPVRPSNLSHVVYVTPDMETSLRFFVDVIGFEVSDQVPGIVAFTRCGEVHHNLALQQGPVAYPHHIAFEVDDINDVVRGGAAMVDADPDRHVWGVGRHAIGSNWFWYMREPGGTYVEYAADIDRISAQDLYQPKAWEGREALYSYGPTVPPEFLVPRDIEDLIANS